eukprot:534568-Rhodomonas_salina.6
MALPGGIVRALRGGSSLRPRVLRTRYALSGTDWAPKLDPGTSLIQNKVPLSREHPYFEVLILDDALRDKEGAVSVGIAGQVSLITPSHISLRPRRY